MVLEPLNMPGCPGPYCGPCMVLVPLNMSGCPSPYTVAPEYVWVSRPLLWLLNGAGAPEYAWVSRPLLWPLYSAGASENAWVSRPLAGRRCTQYS